MKSRGLFGLLTIVIASLLVSVFATTQLKADTQPYILGRVTRSDRNHPGDNGQMLYSVSKSQYTRADKTEVGVYFDPSRASGEVTLQKALTGSACAGISVNVKIGGNAPVTLSCRSGSLKQVVNLSGVAVDAATNKKRVLVTVTNNSTANGYFRFMISSKDGVVRPIASSVTSYESATGRPDNDTYANYRVPFGSDCTITDNRGVWKTVKLIDPDNFVYGRWHGDPSAQGSGRKVVGGEVVYEKETMRAYIIGAPNNISQNNMSPLSASEYRNRVNAGSEGSGTGYRILPMGSDDPAQVSSFEILMKPSYRYTLVIENMKTNNSIQVQLPTDSIFYDPGCVEWRSDQASRSRVTNSAANESSQWADYRAGYSQSAYEGQYVKFMHQLRNVGKLPILGGLSAATQTWYTTNPAQYTEGNRFPHIGPGGWRPVGVALSKRLTAANSIYYYYSGRSPGDAGQNSLSVGIADSSRVGQYLCQRIASPFKATDQRWRFSLPACVKIVERPLEYELRPKIGVSTDGMEEGQTKVSGISASIERTGKTRSGPANYAVIRFVIRGDSSKFIGGGEGVTVPKDPSVPGNLIPDWPCEIAREIRRKTGLTIDPGDCLGGGLPRNGSGTIITTSPYNVRVKDNDVSSLNLSLGDRLCYTTIVSTYNQNVGRDTFRYAAPKCLVVAKKPKVQFWGGDVRAGKGVITSLSRRGAAYYGSWAEYALFSATTSVDATSSSGAGLSATAAGRGIAGGPISYNRITFGNTPVYGGFNASQSVIPSIFLASGTNITDSNVDVNALPSGVNTRSGNLTLRASTLTPGKRIFIRATGTVMIDGNINYATGPFASVSDMPQLAIIAQNIIINPDVTELNGWLIARESNPSSSNGYVSTCGPVPNPASYTNGLKSTVCDKPLKINGPIIANHLYLRRTAGAEKEHPGIPAEILNLRPDVYLSYFGSSRNSGAIKTSYLREMPPRF